MVQINKVNFKNAIFFVYFMECGWFLGSLCHLWNQLSPLIAYVLLLSNINNLVWHFHLLFCGINQLINKRRTFFSIDQQETCGMLYSVIHFIRLVVSNMLSMPSTMILVFITLMNIPGNPSAKWLCAGNDPRDHEYEEQNSKNAPMAFSRYFLTESLEPHLFLYDITKAIAYS